MVGALFRTMGPFAPAPPPGAQPPPLWGSEEHVGELFGDRFEWGTLERGALEITAFERPRDYGEHFKALYGPTIAARANAQRSEREAEFDAELDDSATNGTVAPPTARASSRSTCWRWANGGPEDAKEADGCPPASFADRCRSCSYTRGRGRPRSAAGVATGATRDGDWAAAGTARRPPNGELETGALDGVELPVSAAARRTPATTRATSVATNEGRWIPVRAARRGDATEGRAGRGRAVTEDMAISFESVVEERRSRAYVRRCAPKMTCRTEPRKAERDGSGKVER